MFEARRSRVMAALADDKDESQAPAVRIALGVPDSAACPAVAVWFPVNKTRVSDPRWTSENAGVLPDAEELAAFIDMALSGQLQSLPMGAVGLVETVGSALYNDGMAVGFIVIAVLAAGGLLAKKLWRKNTHTNGNKKHH